MDKTANKIIVIAGPTASGKTSLAVKLAKNIGGEIINADSRSIYRGMNIGTGKPKRQLAVDGWQLTEYLVDNVPHHLFDIKNPDEIFSVAEFKKLAEEKIKEIQSRGNIPIIVGGTGLYLDTLVYDYELPGAKPNEIFRKGVESRESNELYEELKKLDPKTAGEIDPKNKRRLIRALEIYYETGKSKSEQEKRKPLPKNTLYFAIDLPREKLYEKINKRVKEMFDKGLLDETKMIASKYSPEIPILQTMGYSQSQDFLNDEIDLKEAIAKTQQAHRNLAKRQLTWFRRNKDIKWIKPKIEEILEII